MFRTRSARTQIVMALLPDIRKYIADRFEAEGSGKTPPVVRYSRDIRFFLEEDEKAYSPYRYADMDEDDVCDEDEGSDGIAYEPIPEASDTDACCYSLSLDDESDPVRNAFFEAFDEYRENGRYNAVRSMLDEYRDETFSEKVLSLISQKNLRYPKVYKAANLDRRLFSRMMSDPCYQPSRDTALAIAFALHLSLEQARDLLSRAGYALSHSDKRDIIIEYFFLQEEYDLTCVNIALYDLGEKPIGYR